MKKIISLLTLAVLPFIVSAQKVEMKFNLEKGKTYWQTMSMVMTTEQSMQGMTATMEMTMTGGISYLVKDALADHYDVEIKYENLAIALETPAGMAVSMSSADNDPNSAILRDMTGVPIKAKMDRMGKILEMEGLDEMITNSVKNIPGVTPDDLEAQIANLEGAFGEEALKNNFEASTVMFPPHKVAVGDTWTNTTRMTTPVLVEMTTNFKYDGNEGDYRLISGFSEFDMGGEQATIQQGDIEMKYDLTGTYTANYKVHKESGWVSSGTIDLVMNMTAYYETPMGTMPIPMKMKGVITISDK